MTDTPVETSMETEAPISGAWTGIGVTRGFEPPPATKLRLTLVGPSGGGKSTFIMGRPRNLVLSFEDSAHMVPYPKAHRIFVKNFQVLEDCWALLEKEKDSPKRAFDCVSFDVIDQFSDMMDEHLGKVFTARLKKDIPRISDFGSHGKGIAILRGEVMDRLKQLTEWGYAWTVLSHIGDKLMRTATGEEFTTKKITAMPSLVSRLLAQSDYCMLAQKKAVPITTSEDVVSNLSGVGKITRKVTKTEMVDQHSITCSNAHLEEPKARIKINKELILPDVTAPSGERGWDVFSQSYTQSCDEYRETSGQ